MSAYNLKIGRKTAYDVKIKEANSLTMIAESKLTKQFIYKFYHHENFFLITSQDTATLN